MRKLGLSMLVCSMAMVPYAAFSQQSSAPSADDYVCALTGECAEQAAPEQTTNPDGTPRVSATRGFSLSRPNTTRPAPKATPARPNQRTASRPTQRTTRPAQPGRVDLRLSFSQGSSALSPGAQTQVRTFAEALRRPQLVNVRVRIEGHTDSSGGRAMNMNLSQKRAQAVADYLVAQGVAANRLEVRGYGYDRPLPGRRAADSANRRVEAARIS
jgi:outer membrane protein OmpA-like peptidoglycan-associated protein